MQASPSAAPTAVRGANTGTCFATERRADGSDGAYEPFESLYIGTEWVGSVLQTVVRLGETDLSAYAAVSAVDGWTTTFDVHQPGNPIKGTKALDFTITIELHSAAPQATFTGTLTDATGKCDWKGAQTESDKCDAKTTALRRASAPRGVAALFAARNETAADAVGDAGAVRDSEKRARAAALAVATATTATAPAPAGDLSVMELLNVTTLVLTNEKDEKTGETKSVDRAQERTGTYFQKMLIGALPDSHGHNWLSELYGPAPTLTKNVTKIAKENKAWLAKQAVPNMGQLLRDNVKDAKHKDVIAKIDDAKLADNWKAMGQSDDYAALSQKLYLEGYRDAVPDIQPFLNDTASHWGEQFYDYITGPTFLNVWATQVASGAFKNVKQTMYEHYVKLQLLNDAESDAEHKVDPKQALSIMFATILNAQYNNARWIEDMKPYLASAIDNLLNGTADFGDEILDQNAKEQQKILDEMVSSLDTQVELVNALANVFTAWTNLKPPSEQSPLVEMPNELIIAELEEELSSATTFTDKLKSLGSKAGSVLKIVAFGALAGYFLYQVIGNKGKDVAADIGLTITATGFLIKGIESFMATRLGNWISESISASEGSLKPMLEGFTKWFSEAGVESESIMVRMLGKNSSEFFAKRLGPALAVFAVVMCSIDLAKAIKTGDVRDIVFESLNLAVAVASLVFIGLELFGFAWAGPVGLAIAAVGLIIVLVQFIWNLIDPPAPPPDPIEEFINKPLKEAGYTK